MNKLIAKLYDQAIVIEDGGDYVCGELDPVKFAELIVRECAKTIEAQDVDPSFKNRMSWAIKKQFGVELDVNETLRNRSTYFGNDI